MSETTNLINVPVDSIIESESSLRPVQRDTEAYQGLVASMREKGFIGSISVRPVKTIVDGVTVDRYEILDGLHRWNAARDTGIKTIPCFVKQMDKADVLEWQMMANYHKVDTKPAAYAQQLQKLIVLNPALTLNEIATKLGMSTATIMQRLDLLKLSDSIQKLVDDGKITLTNAHTLSKLPEEEQAGFVDFAVGKSPKEFAELVNNRKKEINEARKAGKVAGPPVFAPISILRKKDELETELNNPIVVMSLIEESGVNTIKGAVQMAISYALSLDPRTIATKKAEWEQREKDKAADAEKRKTEREAKKIKDAQEFLAKAGV
jgi:ParB family chromosome partitioning protein